MVDTRGTAELRQEVVQLLANNEKMEKNIEELKSMIVTMMNNMGIRSGDGAGSGPARVHPDERYDRPNNNMRNEGRCAGTYQVPTRCSTVDFPRFNGDKYHMLSSENLGKDVPRDELEGMGDNLKVNMYEVEKEKNEIKVFVELPKFDTFENKMVQPYVENHAPQVFDQKPNKDLVENDRELWYCNKNCISKSLCNCTKNMYMIEKCGIDDDWRIIRYSNSTCEGEVMIGNSKQGEFVVIFEKGPEEIKAENVKSDDYQSTLLGGLEGLDEIEVIIEQRDVQKTYVMSWLNNVEREGVLLITISSTLTIVLLSQTRSKSKRRNRFLGNWPELPLPPPEPPPKQL